MRGGRFASCPAFGGILLASTLLAAGPVAAANPYAELRAYPSGVITSLGARIDVGARNQAGLSVAYDHAERGDAGRHDDESGEGFGIGADAQRFFSANHKGWFYGARAELFRLDIDWRDQGSRGSSRTTILQPTARIGYGFSAGSHWSIEAAGSLGAEINIATQGRSVGEGAIALLGLSVSHRE